VLLKIVLDTNILISAFLSQRSSPYKCLQIAQSSKVTSITCIDILQEFQEKLASKFKLPNSKVQQEVQKIVDCSEIIIISNSLNVVAADPKDNMVIECAVIGGATHIITGDKKHLLPLVSYQGIAIISASEFLKLFDPELGDV